MTTPSYDKATALLRGNHLLDACSFLEHMIDDLPGTSSIAERAGYLAGDLNRLLAHFVSGADDPQRSALLDRLYDGAWSLCEELYDIETSYRPRQDADLPTQLSLLLADPYNDTLLGQAFELLAECHRLSDDDRDAIGQALLSEALPDYVRASLLSALMLSLLQWFDGQMTESLYIYTLDDQPVQLQMQAWVALVLVALIHRDRIAHLPRLRSLYEMLCDANAPLLNTIQIALLQCREVQSASSDFHRIIDQIDENNSEEENTEHVKRFLEFFSEGVDLSFKTFRVQSRFPFFSLQHNRHHWLMPFRLNQPMVRGVFDANADALPWGRMIMHSVAQCDTDKYATLITMRSMADGKMINNIGKRISQSGIELGDEIFMPARCVLRNYLHDLYRYCMLHPRGIDMRYPVFHDLLLCHNPWLQPAVSDIEELDRVADLLLRKKHWAEAAQVYELLLQRQPDSEPVLTRLAQAYCCQTRDAQALQQGIQTLRRCNQLYPGNRRTLCNLADVLHEAQDYVAEHITLHDALLLTPHEATLLARMGRCLNAMGRYREAIEPLFQADLAHEGRRLTQRELALALMATGDTDRARRYAQLALDHEHSRAPEYIVSGHLALVTHDVASALERYQAHPGPAALALRRDRQLLLALGVLPITIDLMLEKLPASDDD